MNYNDLLKSARENFNGTCKVCKICNGLACAGDVPGMGGKGSGSSFIENRKSLEKIKINMRVIHNVSKPDTSIELFGRKMSSPIFAAPVSGTILNMGGKVSEKEYIEPVVRGCSNSGIYAMVGDTNVDTFLLDNLDVLKDNRGNGIVFIKPWNNSKIIEKIRLSEEAGAFAVGVDLDACGLINNQFQENPFSPKTIDEIRELVESTRLPFIIKGIMTVDDAFMAVESGASAIIVSNHGGRVLDYTPGTCEVLPDIAKSVKGKITILVDGGVRTGVDVVKMLGLGADAVLMGRPFVTASFGGGLDGVEFFIEKVRNELCETMILTGCQNVKDIDGRVIWNLL
ncbi:TPA: alpha-hydroxy-acid oxidizing protein [Clostridioides difficile]|uniref:alpha-hydroxy-acid oxidizing protein n=1 Tax=Clostridioides difficile TaxID=1496 RepID=UPI0010262DC2|nr:alpha-hydroxy-acid oxidizing protein [Clostridioides difficile]EGT4967066.1 alpha-hydroxy-acid oxidizing protein [Clostridioides difficile]MBH7280303.1 alpha-hydroxy-acid oxidizing protein [Clostridioides difficile]MBH7345513.1 alpha-hydroxy-acid oxidizing protein [Clostridioides difficile]MBZ0709211.1 alpha-hydroxy-acid oxidizing protein [Clostridioides difficile]MCJ0143720.1 alpha-hydroxy-acid oxidizing protein [Clostridioides difficile]